MPRNEFGRDLRFLQEELLAVGSMVEKAIANAVDALKVVTSIYLVTGEHVETKNPAVASS